MVALVLKIDISQNTKCDNSVSFLHLYVYSKATYMYIYMWLLANLVTTKVCCKWFRLPELGHSKHCSVEANVTPDNSKQHWWKDNVLLSDNSSSQWVVLKQTGAAMILQHKINNDHAYIRVCTGCSYSVKHVGSISKLFKLMIFWVTYINM